MIKKSSPNLFLRDIMMPDFKSYDVCKALTKWVDVCDRLVLNILETLWDRTFLTPVRYKITPPQSSPWQEEGTDERGWDIFHGSGNCYQLDTCFYKQPITRCLEVEEKITLANNQIFVHRYNRYFDEPDSRLQEFSLKKQYFTIRLQHSSSSLASFTELVFQAVEQFSGSYLSLLPVCKIKVQDPLKSEVKSPINGVGIIDNSPVNCDRVKSLKNLYSFCMKLPKTLTHPILPLLRRGTLGGGIYSMQLYKELILVINPGYDFKNLESEALSGQFNVEPRVKALQDAIASHRLMIHFDFLPILLGNRKPLLDRCKKIINKAVQSLHLQRISQIQVRTLPAPKVGLLSLQNILEQSQNRIKINPQLNPRTPVYLSLPSSS